MLENLSSISFQTVVYGNTLWRYAVALVILIFVFTAASLFRKLIDSILKKLLKNVDGEFFVHILNDVGKLVPIIQYIPFLIIEKHLIVPPVITRAIYVIGVIIITICIVRCISSIVRFVSNKYFANNSNELLKNTIDIFAGVVLWVMGGLFVLSNLGFNINTLLAGVGIGGMAIALASQHILGDLFNYFTILIDKPFAIGD
ncbi:MAG: mechanosensitive ion channel family protein, partial [Elusimicrobiota bacterium]|nr:mechanosensitive ion channel family protein [Elusimicrobiota bacterium]